MAFLLMVLSSFAGKSFFTVTMRSSHRADLFIPSFFPRYLPVLGDITEGTTSSSDSKSIYYTVVDLHSIGYEGSWAQFCDYAEIEKDFARSPGHELKKLRTILCALRSENTTRSNEYFVPTFAVYKYCSMVSLDVDEDKIYEVYCE